MNTRIRMAALGLLAAFSVLAAWRLTGDQGVVPRGLSRELVAVARGGVATDTVEAVEVAAPEREEAATDELAGFFGDDSELKARVEDLYGDSAEPKKWTVHFEIDRSLVYARGYPRGGADRKTQYFGAISFAEGPSIELGRLSLPESGPGVFSFLDRSVFSAVEGGVLVLASSPEEVGPGFRVYLDQGLTSRVSRTLSPADIVSRDATSGEGELDLGRLVLVPAPRLGRVRVDPREEASDFELSVSPQGRQSQLLSQFGRTQFGGRRSMTSIGGQVEAFSFVQGDQWSALLKTKEGHLLGMAEGARGTDLVIPYVPPQGVTVSVDLSRTPTARRIVVNAAGTWSPTALDGAMFDSYLRTALRSAAIPLARFRGPETSYTTGLLEVEDGGVRVELWSRDWPKGWKRSVVRPVTVAGSVTQVRM